jgi:ATP/maltotriose-dependent transcriptional regulator MalT
VDLVGSTLGQYQIVEPLGQGGMATVFRAYQPALDRDVAIKVLPAQHALTPGFAERFVREARAVAQLNHPNILPVIDFGQDGDITFIVMKLVSGGTLKDRLGLPMDPIEIARTVEQIAAALDHAHGRGILHRDVKPSNVLIDEGDWIQLADFGLAKMMVGDGTLTGSGAVLGTPSYMAPEQGMGTTVDHRADIYSLGVILYEMVTGQLPFYGDNSMVIIVKHINEPVPPPCSVNPSVPQVVEGVILKALAKAPNERYASAGELARALQQAVEPDSLGFAPAPATEAAYADATLAPGFPSEAVAVPTPPAVHVAPSQPMPPPEITLPPETPRPPQVEDIVGRESELARAREQLSAAHMAMLTGMAGVGKTTLAATLAREVTNKENIFWHSFHEGEGVNAIVWKLAGFLYWRGQDGLWRMLQGAQLTGSQPPPIEVLFDYLFQMLRGQGYLLCLDDLHFVEEDPLLEQLIERLRDVVQAGELSLIVTSRHVPKFLQAGEYEVLGGLSSEDTSALLAARGLSLSQYLTTNLYTHTEGNAQLLTLATEALRQARHPERMIANLAEAEDIERYLIKEVDDSLEKEEREVMSAIAVLMSYPGTRDAIETVLDGGSVRRVLSDLGHRHLLTVGLGEWGREYGLHAIVQTFYYGLLGRRDRQEMHARAGQYYEEEEPDSLKAAIHYQHAGDHERSAELATGNTWTLINRGQARPLRALLERFRPGRLEPPLRAAVYIAQGQVYTLLGEGSAAGEIYEEALSCLSDLAISPKVSELRARACQGIGELLEHESPQEAMEWLRRGLDELAGGRFPSEEAALYIKIGSAHLALGNLDDALSATERGLALLPTGPSQLRASALLNLGMLYGMQGDLARVQKHMEQGLEICRQLYDDFRMSEVLNNLGIVRYMTGDWEGAIAYWQQALDLAEKLGSVEQQAKLAHNLGLMHLKQGSESTAHTYLTNSLELMRTHSMREYEIEVCINLAELYLLRQDVDAAVASLTEAEALVLEIDAKPHLPAIHRGWAHVHLWENDVQAAHGAIEKSLELARSLELSPEEGISLRVLGQVYLAQEKPGPALETFERSLDILAEQDPYEAARTRVQVGQYWIAHGDAARGQASLAEAQATFRQLGAQSDLAAVENTLSGR